MMCKIHQKVILDASACLLGFQADATDRPPHVALIIGDNIPLVDAQQKRRLTWQWPQTQWDVIIDPMAEHPLRVVAKSGETGDVK